MTPSLNQGRYIEETIRSVLLQGYPDLEYMVLDGGSCDGTLDILERYRPWLAFLSSGPDAGQADAIRQGLERASGDLFNWVNSDDVLAPGALAMIARRLREGTDVVAGAAVIVGEGGGEVLRRPRRLTVDALVRGDEGMSLCQPAIWLCTANVVACGGPDPAFNYFFDHELYLRYLACFPAVVYDDGVIARFRLHEASKTVADGERFRDEYVRALEKLASCEGFECLHARCRRRLAELDRHCQVRRLLDDVATPRWRRALELVRLSRRPLRAGALRISLAALRRLVRGERWPVRAGGGSPGPGDRYGE